MKKKLPFITLKYAQSLDGKIALSNGESKWISGKESRIFAHKLRAKHDAILVGINTIIKDNPKLTIRLYKGKNPIRIILDSKLRIPLNSFVLNDNNKTIIVTLEKSLRNNKRKYEILKKRDIEFITIRKKSRDAIYRVSTMKNILYNLGNLGIKSILVEGGSKVITSFIKNKLVDELIVITAPIYIGRGLDAIGDLGIKSMDDALKLNLKKFFKSGKDYIFIFKNIKNEK
jgi:diaminohydroxyphosphoribosylaminopyrimidine deaminase / 5-amino-6-(5-phosphoribosylamino)uracil reductase